MYRRVHPARTRHGGVKPPLRSLGCRPRPKPLDGGPKRALDLAHGGFVFVLLARPEKSLQPVLLAAWNDVDVEVRHALTDAVVDGDERAFGSERELCGARQELSVQEKRGNQRGWQIEQSLKMLARNQQTMAGEKRPVVKERQGRLVFENRATGDLAAHDLAKGAVLPAVVKQASALCILVHCHRGVSYSTQPDVAGGFGRAKLRHAIRPVLHCAAPIRIISQEVNRASADSADAVLSGPDGGPLAFRTVAADRPRGAAARGIVGRSRTVRV